MYHNVHYPVAALAEGVVKPPGACSIKYFKWEDVLTWPAVDPETGILASAVTLKPGKFLYLCGSINPSRSFEENEKESGAGTYFESTIKGSLMGSSAAQILTLGTLKHHQWGLIVTDKNGVTRLIGNEDAGADIIIDYTSGQGSASRKTELTWKWLHPQPAPIYSAQAFDIIIGGELLSAGCIQYITGFRVGDPGAPMNDGDTIFTNSGIVNKRVLVIVDGVALPVDDFSGDIDWSTSIDRHVEKAQASNTINFVGAVVDEEVIQIYAYTP